MLTPFSGLSLIVHLGIIGYGTVLDRTGRRTKRKLKRNTFLRGKVSLVFSSAMSICICLVISGFMLYLFGLAIETSVREGAHEWQRQYLQQLIHKALANSREDGS